LTFFRHDGERFVLVQNATSQKFVVFIQNDTSLNQFIANISFVAREDASGTFLLPYEAANEQLVQYFASSGGTLSLKLLIIARSVQSKNEHGEGNKF
jgi:hypothetical protein